MPVQLTRNLQVTLFKKNQECKLLHGEYNIYTDVC